MSEYTITDPAHEITSRPLATLPLAPRALPKPATTMALLVSDGNGKPTLHYWVMSRHCADGVEHLFECSNTHVQRRWGLVCP